MNYDEILKQKAAALDRSNWDCYEPNYFKKGDEKNTASAILEMIVSKGIQVKEKAKGVEDSTDVPYFPVSECMWTFVGSFSILSLITFLSSCIALWNEEGKAFAFPLGPFGALTTLQCSLTDAAPAQPRNVLCGSTLCGFIALLSTYIPEEIVPLWLRISLATSASISAMARLGIMHPPGGAIALVFSMGGHTFIHLVFTLMSCCLAVFIATVVNNLNDDRQYPRYWNILAPLFQNRKH
jgi:CBS-domain-containing membrane protein